MTIRFSEHAKLRVRERFAEPGAAEALERFIKSELTHLQFPQLPGNEIPITGTIWFRRVKVIVVSGFDRNFTVKTAMWVDRR